MLTEKEVNVGEAIQESLLSSLKGTDRQFNRYLKLGNGLDQKNIVLFKRTVSRAGLRIRIHFIRIRIQHFRLNTDPDPGL